MHNIEHLLIKIPLKFESKIYTNVFKDKNNSTLQETIKSPRYKSLITTVFKKYSQDLDTNLGDFLIKLKKRGDSFYKKFLNKYGDLEYSTFYLANEEQYDLKGVYFYYLNNELKYIGRCRDKMKSRVNNGYGKISPKKCFIDGQSTNCKVNALITKHRNNITLKIYAMNDIKEIENLEKRLIDMIEPDWNKRK